MKVRPGFTPQHEIASVLALMGPAAEIALPDAPPAVQERLGPLQPILQAIVFLQLVGTAAELKGRADAILAGAATALTPPRAEDYPLALPHDPETEEPTEWGRAVFVASAAHHHRPELLRLVRTATERLYGDLMRLAQRAAEYEEVLSAQDLRFDSATRHVLTATGEPGRPAKVFQEIVGEVFEGLHAGQSLPKQTNTAEVRARIARHLAGFFPESWLTPERKGTLANALQNYLAK